jgi:hypothetical protein
VNPEKEVNYLYEKEKFATRPRFPVNSIISVVKVCLPGADQEEVEEEALGA